MTSGEAAAEPYLWLPLHIVYKVDGAKVAAVLMKIGLNRASDRMRAATLHTSSHFTCSFSSFRRTSSECKIVLSELQR